MFVLRQNICEIRKWGDGGHPPQGKQPNGGPTEETGDGGT